MHSSTTSHKPTNLLIICSALFGLLMFAGCKGDSSKEKSQKETKAPAESEAPAEPSGEKEAEGTASIDNAGITEVPTDPALVKKGEELFKSKGCTACHKMGSKVVGPALGGVTERRDAAWIARMIMHPEKMLEVDETAKELLAKHMTPMPNQNVSPEQAKAIIAYLGTQKKK